MKDIKKILSAEIWILSATLPIVTIYRTICCQGRIKVYLYDLVMNRVIVGLRKKHNVLTIAARSEAHVRNSRTVQRAFFVPFKPVSVIQAKEIVVHRARVMKSVQIMDVGPVFVIHRAIASTESAVEESPSVGEVNGAWKRDSGITVVQQVKAKTELRVSVLMSVNQVFVILVFVDPGAIETQIVWKQNAAV